MSLPERSPARPRRVAVLGPVVLSPGDVGGPLARALLVALAVGAVRPGALLGVDALADDVWGEDPPRNPRGALQTLVSRLRAAGGADLVVSGPAGYALGPGEDDVDLTAAQGLLARAEACRPEDPARLDLTGRALALWRGEVGADLGDAPVTARLVEAADALRSRLIALRAEALTAQSRPAEAATLLEASIAGRPLDESAHRALMTALAEDGRRTEALAVFARLRAHLRDELGVSPEPETEALNLSVLRAEPSAPRIRIGLRAAPNELIGRDGDLAAVTELLRRSRLVTVLGAGGLGKTRLAQAVAAASAAPTVIVVELASVRADEDVAAAIAAVLGLSEAVPGSRLSEARSPVDLRDLLFDALAERSTLLVLDNCEQIVDGVARWSAEALAAVPSLRLLTTSRTPLSVAGEVVHPLGPLGTGGAEVDGPAVRLFGERARAVRPRVELPPAAVGRLCARLDGLPLAIELAAARVRTMSVEQIDAHLGDRFSLLRSADRTAPPRHRTLEAVIAWSWDLTDPAAREAMTRLAVLPAGFGAHAAAHLIGRGDLETEDVLDRLVAQSLLVVTEEAGTAVRFRMLETVREFALARLGEGADAAWAAARGWAVAFASAHDAFPLDPASFHAVRAEHDNLVAVLRRALDEGADADAVAVYALLCREWVVRGGFTEMMAIAPRVLAVSSRPSSAAAPSAAKALVLLLGIALAKAFADSSDARRGPEQLEGLEPTALGADLASRSRVARELLDAGTPLDPELRTLLEIVLEVDDVAGVRPVLERICRGGAAHGTLLASLLLAQLAENTGELEAAREVARRTAAVAEGTGQPWIAGMATATLAHLASEAARPEAALRHLDRFRELLAPFDQGEENGDQAWLRACNLLALGRTDEATSLFAALVERATSTHLDSQDRELAFLGHLGLAEAAWAAGELPRARERFEVALRSAAGADGRSLPWHLTAIAAFVAAAAATEGLVSEETIAPWVRRMRHRSAAYVRTRTQDVDLPVLGTALLGWGAWLLRDEAAEAEAGARAIVLAEVMGARQDLLSLHLAPWQEVAAQRLGPAALESLRREARALGRDEAVRRALYALRM